MKRLLILGTAGLSIGAAATFFQPHNPSQAQSGQGFTKLYRVLSIADGDTITVADGQQRIKVRFNCLDALEVAHTQAEASDTRPVVVNQFRWGNQAKARLTQLLRQGGNQVVLTGTSKDRYGRTISELRLPNSTFIQEVLVREGWAMAYRQ